MQFNLSADSRKCLQTVRMELLKNSKKAVEVHKNVLRDIDLHQSQLNREKNLLGIAKSKERLASFEVENYRSALKRINAVIKGLEDYEEFAADIYTQQLNEEQDIQDIINTEDLLESDRTTILCSEDSKEHSNSKDDDFDIMKFHMEDGFLYDEKGKVYTYEVVHAKSINKIKRDPSKQMYFWDGILYDKNGWPHSCTYINSQEPIEI
ncbi:hypothetical protein WA158_003365 [Blastocystis sp. Blastoise]